MPTRKSGVTTRIIDRCVQELFNKGITYVYEGRGDARNELTETVFTKFVGRLHHEHPNAKYHYDYGRFSDIWCYKVQTHNL